MEVHADGFVAGEDVAVAVVLRHGSAGPGGHMRALIDCSEVPNPDTAEIALVGRISGTASFQPLTEHTTVTVSAPRPDSEGAADAEPSAE